MATGKLQTDIDKPADAKPHVSVLKFNTIDGTTAGKLTTHGGRLLVSITARALGCPAGCAEKLLVHFEGKKVGEIVVQYGQAPKGFYDDSLVLENVAAGTPLVEVKPSTNNSMPFRATLAVVEVPK